MLKGVQRGSWEIVFRLVVCSFSTLEAHLRARTLIEVNYVAGGWSFAKKMSSRSPPVTSHRAAQRLCIYCRCDRGFFFRQHIDTGYQGKSTSGALTKLQRSVSRDHRSWRQALVIRGQNEGNYSHLSESERCDSFLRFAGVPESAKMYTLQTGAVILFSHKLNIFQRRPTTVTMKATKRYKIIGNAPL